MTHRFFRLFGLFLALLALSAPPSRAGLLTVSSPSVDEGKLTAEGAFRSERSGTHAQAYAFEVEYGLTRFWESAVQLTWPDPQNQNVSMNLIEWKNTFLLVEQSESWPVALGLKAEYAHARDSGRNDVLNLRLLASHKFDSGVTAIFNIGTKKEVGAGATDYTGDVRASLRYTLNKWATPALDYLGDTGEITNRPTLDRQRHRAGPVLSMKINDKLSGEIGYLAGLTRAAPDHSVKLNLKFALGD